MWRELKAFSPPKENLTLKSRAWVELGVLKVAFNLTGDLGSVLAPMPVDLPARVIGLWESTCFEMFIKNSEKEEYFEFNCSSANNWNIFYFPKKRAALKEFTPISNLASSTVLKDDQLSVSFWIDLKKLPIGFWIDGQMKLGLTSVLESKSGGLSYWALEHLDTKPNFHKPESFSFLL
ncbi:MAG: hypothetical protein ACJAT2_003226 [Bacteriovoracaceae bacterium]|jgi:hypothetical protein